MVVLSQSFASPPHANLQPEAQHKLVNVPEEVKRARKLKCKLCGQYGAAMGCDVPTCKQVGWLKEALQPRRAR
jgi:hypothetical protein